MYPTLGQNVGQGGQSSGNSYNAGFSGRYPQQPGASGAQNGPALQPSGSFHGGGTANFPMLRVHIAEEYRTFPPVGLLSEKNAISWLFEPQAQRCRAAGRNVWRLAKLPLLLAGDD